MKATFQLNILAHDKIIYRGKATYCGVTTLAGSIGFEANHEAFAGILKPQSTIEYTPQHEEPVAVDILQGVLTFKENKCTLTVSL